MNQFCACSKDGWCERYQRVMTGRFRELCAGVNCDLGSAAAFREQWLQESKERRVMEMNCRLCKGTGYIDPPIICGPNTPQAEIQAMIESVGEKMVCPSCKGSGRMKPTPLLLKTDQAPGDAVVMTAAIYSLHKAYPGKYLTAVESPYPEVFAHNPDVAVHFLPNQLDDEPNVPDNLLPLQMHYPAIHQSNERGIHFMQAYCEFLGSALGISVPLLTNRPRLYFPQGICEDKGYWLICSGGKKDLTNKLWGHMKYQEVVARCPTVEFRQVGKDEADHPRLRGTDDLVGQTSLRQLFDLVRSARGVVCGVSLLMHVAAALNKPAIIIAGGREPVQWNAYPKQHYLHTVGMLQCSDPKGNIGGACWRSRVEPLTDMTVLNENLCERPHNGVPECMTLIQPDTVARLVLQYESEAER